MLRRRREPRQVHEGGRSSRRPFLRVGLAQQLDRARLVRAGVEGEGAGLAEHARRPDDRPSRENAGESGDVGLAVAAADADRVQLQDFAAQVLVEAAVRALAGSRVRADGARVVEEVQHRRMTLGGQQHVGEPPEHVRADRLALERAGGDSAEAALRRADAEMVGPEGDEPLGESGAGFDRTMDPRQRLAAEDRLLRVPRLHLLADAGFLGHRRCRAGACLSRGLLGWRLRSRCDGG